MIKYFVALICLLWSQNLIAQEIENGKNFNELEIGPAIAGAEYFYYGLYSRYTIPLTHTRHYLKAGVGITYYFDVIGETIDNARLENDIDMRLIPSVFVGYNMHFNRVDCALELPIGTSIAITKGTLVNDRIGFERSYSNTEFLFHFGVAVSAKYQLNEKNKIGLYGFIPLVKDFSWTSPLIGLGWTRRMTKK